MAFDIDRFMHLSRAVEIGDLDWDYIARVGITDHEARCLRYLSDIESHAVLYEQDLLAGHSSKDYEIVAFLACWAYEEMHHGRALDKFLSACGRPPQENRYTKVTQAASLKEDIEAWLGHTAAKLTPHFAATHMAWGALNEMTSSLAYTRIAECTKNKELAKLVTRMAKDERRHLAFYYHQAEQRLAGSKLAQKIARSAFEWFWDPVGVGVGDDDSLGFFVTLLFDDVKGMAEFKRIDQDMGKLPGLEGFNLVHPRFAAAGEAFKRKHPAEARELAAHRSRELREPAAPDSEGPGMARMDLAS